MGEIVRDILTYGDEYNTTTQNKTNQLGWCGIIIGKKTPPPPPPPPPPHHNLKMDDELKKVMQPKTI